MAALAAPAAAASPGFTGNFSQSAGSVFDGGDYDRTSAIAIDTWTAGGPFVYVVGGSSDNAAGTEYGLIVKYGSDGVMLASDTYRNVKSMFRSVQFDAAGDLAVSGNVDSAFLVVKYNKALSRLNSTSISGGGDGWALASDSQSNLYLAGPGHPTSRRPRRWLAGGCGLGGKQSSSGRSVPVDRSRESWGG